jgi:hypothetical protein
MKSAILRGAQVLLAAGAVCLLAALIIPWKEPKAALPQTPTSAAPEASPSIAQEKSERAAPQTIVALFVKRAPAAPMIATRGAPAPEVKKPVDAPWLSYLGFYTGAPGKPYYLLKDTRSGRVIQLPQAGVFNGWSLVEVSDKRLVVRNADDVFIVNKR